MPCSSRRPKPPRATIWPLSSTWPSTVTAETAPHYFSLDHSRCRDFSPMFKVNPPLREPDDVNAVAEGLDNAEAAGCEEIFMVPATADIAELDRLCDIIAAR